MAMIAHPHHSEHEGQLPQDDNKDAWYWASLAVFIFVAAAGMVMVLVKLV